MSRYYSMTVTIKNPTNIEATKEAAESEWNFSDWHENEGCLIATEEGHLAGGESEEEFAARLSEAIWEANEEYCEVEINCTYLEEIPCETYTFKEEEYQEYLKGLLTVD